MLHLYRPFKPRRYFPFTKRTTIPWWCRRQARRPSTYRFVFHGSICCVRYIHFVFCIRICIFNVPKYSHFQRIFLFLLHNCFQRWREFKIHIALLLVIFSYAEKTQFFVKSDEFTEQPSTGFLTPQPETKLSPEEEAEEKLEKSNRT